MKRLKHFPPIYKVVFIIIVSFCIPFLSQSQTTPVFEEHEVIDIGSGMKLEILRSRGTGEDQEWDVIYYTDKRQLGKRKWEKTAKIIELQQAGKITHQQPKQEINQSERIAKAEVKTKAIEEQKTTSTKAEAIEPLPVETSADKSSTTFREESKSIPTVTPNERNIPADSFAAAIPTAAVAKPSPPADTIPDMVTVTNKPLPPKQLSNITTYVVHTLADCYQLAKEKNPVLKQANNLIATNIIDHRIAENSLLPSVSYNLGHYFSFGKNIDPVTNAYVNNNFSGGYTAVNLQLQLFSGFSRLNTIKQSAYNIQAADYAMKRAALELLTNVTLAYARLMLDNEQLLVERKNIEGTAKQIEVINEKIKVGRLSKYEFYTFNARLNTQQANLISLQNDSSAASQDIKELLNLSYKEDFHIATIDTTVFAGISSASISPVEFVESILSNHPAIKQAQMQEQAALMGEKIAKGSFYPSLSVGGNIASNYNVDQLNATGSKVPLYNQLNDNIGKNININLHIPIFSQMETSNRVKKEVINISNAQLALEQARNTITTNTIKLVNDFTAAKERYNATKSAWDQNNLSYSLYEEKYKLGQLSSMELLLAQDTQNASTLQFLQAKLQMFFQFQLMGLLKGY